MSFPDLGVRIKAAAARKPEFGATCNSCGWCCLTEVCQMGEYYGASAVIPCEFLVTEMDNYKPKPVTPGCNYKCKLIIDGTMEEKVIGIGNGCDAITQDEQLETYAEQYKEQHTGGE